MTSNIKVLYEDDNIIVCVKPAGVLSQGDKKGNKDMVRELKKYLVLESVKKKVKLFEEPYISVVHRVDRNVRGIMVYAKTKAAAAGLSKQIRENKFSKKYMAVVSFDNEKVSPVLGRWENRIDYLIVDKAGNLSKIADQVRLQMSEIFNGIAGDTKYNPDYKNVTGWQETALEAVELSFIHPVTKERMSFNIPTIGKEFGEI